MIRLKQLSLRAKLILAFCVIASFTLISSGSAVYLFQYYQKQLVLMAQRQGEPLVISTDIIEDIQNVNLQLERIKGTDTLKQRLLSLNALETQWHDIIEDLNDIQDLNPSLTPLFHYTPSSLEQLLTAIPSLVLFIKELSSYETQKNLIHRDILNQQKKIIESFNIEIILNREKFNTYNKHSQSIKMNLLTDVERKINQVSSLLLEALSSNNNDELSHLARKSLLIMREIKILGIALESTSQLKVQAWLIQIQPYVASAESVFRQGKKEIKLKKVLTAHIQSHQNMLSQLNTSTHDVVSYLKQDIIDNANKLAKDISFASNLLIALAIACLISVMLIIWLFVGYRIIRPFIETSKAMHLLSQGETHVKLPKSNDREVQRMLNSLQILQQYVIKVNELAEVDSLTELYNRRFFDNLLNTALENKQINSTVSLLMCDLDHFKPYNDYYGHQQGDNCLKFFSQILQRLTNNTSDYICRYGGEEFAIIILNKPAHYAESLAQLICNETHKALIPHKKSECSDVVTVSVGVASLMVGDIKSPNQLINDADHALYQAKKNGRNSIHIHQ